MVRDGDGGLPRSCKGYEFTVGMEEAGGLFAVRMAFGLFAVREEEAFCFEVVGDGAARNAEFFCDFDEGVAILVEFYEAVGFAVEDSFGCCAFCSFRATKSYAFFALCMNDVETTAGLHAAFDFDDFAEVVDEERHRAVGVEGGRMYGARGLVCGGFCSEIVQRYEGAVIGVQVLHDLKESWEAAAEGGDVSGDYCVSGADWFYEVLYAVAVNLACEVILNPGVVSDGVVFAPQFELLTFLLERL